MVLLVECPWCSGRHSGVCSLVSAIEYFESGGVKRVEFREIAPALTLSGTMTTPMVNIPDAPAGAMGKFNV